jgi:hypothetical protein
MQIKNVLATAAMAGISAIAAAAPYTATRAEGERCMGADGHSAEEWLPCADPLECVADAALGYGKFCKARDHRKDGERCRGADGYPAVAWLKCHDDSECVAVPELGWGMFCKEREYRVEGERCKGVKGKPEVKWIPCAVGLKCVGEKALGYEKHCKAVEYLNGDEPEESEEPEESDEPEESAEPDYTAEEIEAPEPVYVATTEPPVCEANWETCGGRGSAGVKRACCNPTFECVDAAEETYEGLRCEPKKD